MPEPGIFRDASSSSEFRGMGKATRWLRSLLSRKKDLEDQRENSSSSSFERREKKRWSFCRTVGGGSSRSPASEQSWARSGYDMNEEDKHAIAVAVAATTAATVAVTAAKVAMVRLRSFDRECVNNSYIRAFAAIRIQTAFRGYLARRALAALKAVVKLQAVIRGHLVRKKAAATLHQLQALVKAQMFSRAQTSRNSIGGGRRWTPELYPRRSFERWKHNNGTEKSPKIVEIDACQPKSRSFRASVLQPVDEPITSSLPSMLLHKLPPRLSIPSHRVSFKDYKWSLSSERGRLYARTAVTAQNTPRFTPPPQVETPAKSPNYMASTRSFDAKVRSQSAPKHRWETPKYCRPESPRSKEKAPVSATWDESRASLSGHGMRRSFTQMREACNLKRGMVVRKLDKATDEIMSRELARDYYLDTMW